MSYKGYIRRWQIPELAPFSAAQRRFIFRVAMRVLRRDDFLCWAFVQFLAIGWVVLCGMATITFCANSKGLEFWVPAAALAGVGALGLQIRTRILHRQIRPIIEQIIARHGERIRAILSRFGINDSVGCALHVARHLVRTIRFRSALPFIAYLTFAIFVFITERPDSAGSVGVIDIRLTEAGHLATIHNTTKQIGFVSRIGSSHSGVLLEIENPLKSAPHRYVALWMDDGETLGEFDSETLKSSPFARIEMTSVEHYFKRIDSPLD